MCPVRCPSENDSSTVYIDPRIGRLTTRERSTAHVYRQVLDRLWPEWTSFLPFQNKSNKKSVAHRVGLGTQKETNVRFRTVPVIAMYVCTTQASFKAENRSPHHIVKQKCTYTHRPTGGRDGTTQIQIQIQIQNILVTQVKPATSC